MARAFPGLSYMDRQHRLYPFFFYLFHQVFYFLCLKGFNGVVVTLQLYGRERRKGLETVLRLRHLIYTSHSGLNRAEKYDYLPKGLLNVSSKVASS